MEKRQEKLTNLALEPEGRKVRDLAVPSIF